MDGYLVLLRHEMDDLPVGLFSTQKQAEKFAKCVKPMPTKKIRKVFDTDCSTPVCVSIVQFRLDEPVGVYTAKSFE